MTLYPVSSLLHSLLPGSPLSSGHPQYHHPPREDFASWCSSPKWTDFKMRLNRATVTVVENTQFWNFLWCFSADECQLRNLCGPEVKTDLRQQSAGASSSIHHVEASGDSRMAQNVSSRLGIWGWEPLRKDHDGDMVAMRWAIKEVGLSDRTASLMVVDAHSVRWPIIYMFKCARTFILLTCWDWMPEISPAGKVKARWHLLSLTSVSN